MRLSSPELYPEYQVTEKYMPSKKMILVRSSEMPCPWSLLHHHGLQVYQAYIDPIIVCATLP